MKYITKYARIFLLLFIAKDASALGGVSRSCQFSTIPELLKPVAVRFFYAIGAPKSVLALPNATLNEQRRWWILESLTTDYLKVRYFLFAHSLIYGFHERNQYWKVLLLRSSPQWDARQISNQMKQDPEWAPYYANRRGLYSARAGAPEIIEDFSAWGTEYSKYRVIGLHYYYDPITKVIASLSDSFAYDCDLQNWGLGLFDR